MSTATHLPAEEHKNDAVELHCMEIWGGNGIHDTALSVPGIDAHVYSQPQPGHDAGGDIHYVSMCGSGRISRFAVADVSGHGRQAAGVAETLRELMRRNINTLNQAAFARALNEEFTRLSVDGTFATAVLATYFAPEDALILVNAGHPTPLWYSAAEKRWHLLCPELPECTEHVANLPLGVITPTHYQQFAVPLTKDDVIVIYTDSLIEARSPEGKLLGEQGLLEMIQPFDAADPMLLRQELLKKLEAYRGGAPAEDDLTLLVLRHNGANPPWPGIGETIRNIGKIIGLVKY